MIAYIFKRMWAFAAILPGPLLYYQDKDGQFNECEGCMVYAMILG